MRGGRGDFMQVLQELVKPGSLVKKGDVVAEFDRQNMILRLDDFRAALTQAEATVEMLKASLDVERKAHDESITQAKAALDKARLDMKTAPVRSDIDTEKFKLALQEAEARYKQLLGEVKDFDISQKAQLREADIELAQARNELKRVEANVDKMLVRAPMDGMSVMQNLIRGGELSAIQQGDTLYPGQMFAQIVDQSSMVINAAVNQVDVERIRIGQRAKIKFDAYPSLELRGHVTAIGAMTKTGGQRASFFKEVPIFVKLDEIDPRVIPDLSVSADIVLSAENEVPVVPRAAIFGDSTGSEPYVLVRSNGTFEKRTVTLGLLNNTHAAVRSGLNPGDVIALEVPPVKSGGTRIAGLLKRGGGK